MSKILVISPVPTDPQTAGNRARVASLTRALRDAGHTVWFMHVEQEPGDGDAMRADWGERYIPVPYERPAPPRFARFRHRARKLRLDAGYRLGIDEWYDSALDLSIDRFLAEHSVDAVLVEYAFMSRALLRVPRGVLRVLDTHDVLADRHRRYLANGMTPAWFSCSRRAEARALARADVVLAIQDTEADYFRTQCPARVETIGHPIHLQPLPDAAIVPGRILLVGSYNPINLAALEWFVEQVLPHVLARCPGAELAVAGSICSRAVERPGTRLLGRVDQLADAYAAAQVVINPMQFGTGLKIKSVEALGHARALVTTPCGAEGLEAGAGRAFRVAADPMAFADQLSELLLHPERALALARDGHAFAVDYNAAIRQRLQALFGSAN
jgi:hypothetical protein